MKRHSDLVFNGVLTAIVIYAWSVLLFGQSSVVQPGDLVHQYTFTLPTTPAAGQNCFTWQAEAPIAYNPANDSLFLVGHDQTQYIGEVSIPSGPGEATLIQGCADALDGKLGDLAPQEQGAVKIGGIYVDGSRLIISGYVFYDAGAAAGGAGTARFSHFTRPVNLSSGPVLGPYRVGTLNPGFYGGPFTDVPAEWQAAIGSPVLNGLCCTSIISRSSYGPDAFGIDPAEFNGQTTIPADPLLYYAWPDTETLGDYDQTSDVFNGTTRVNGMVAVPGTDSLLYFGRHGTGPFCYGPGSSCGDPTSPYQGTHAYPYRAQVWAYRLSDLAAVKAGTLSHEDPVPYAVFELPGVSNPFGWSGGAAYDPETQRLFVLEQWADGPITGNSEIDGNNKGVVHVFHVGVGSPTDPTPTPDPGPTPDPTPEPDPTPDPTQDQDGDGVPDDADECPDVAGLPSNDGCPVEDEPPPTPTPGDDQDGDGVPDTSDECPDVAGVASNDGCPPEDDDEPEPDPDPDPPVAEGWPGAVTAVEPVQSCRGWWWFRSCTTTGWRVTVEGASDPVLDEGAEVVVTEE